MITLWASVRFSVDALHPPKQFQIRAVPSVTCRHPRGADLALVVKARALANRGQRHDKHPIGMAVQLIPGEELILEFVKVNELTTIFKG